MESAETEHSLGARDAVAIFMSYPECAWDVTHQTVVLYWPLNDRNVDGPLSLVVTFDDGEDGYFAGQLEANEIFWAIHAPPSGAFRLQVYLAAELAPGVDRVVPLRSFRFDPALTVHPDAILHQGQKLRTRLFRLDERTGFTRMSRVREVLPGTSLKRFLDEQGGMPSGWAGLTVTHLQEGNRPADITQGPSAHPFREQGHLISVDFLRRADKRWPIPDGIVIPGFERLTYPVIRLDLTDLGEGARRATDGVTFFRRPLGSAGFKQTLGASLKIHRSDGRIYLIWECAEGCHRDLIGVHFRGGPRLVVRAPSGTDDLRIPFTGSTEPATCIAGLYLGSEVWERPEQAAEFVPEDLGAPFELDLDRVEIERFFAWANEDARVRAANADLRGASRAESCTLYAYTQFLGRLVRQSGGMNVTGLFRRLGLRLDSFGDFARRPDLAFAVIGNEALQQRLLAAGEGLGAPGLEGDFSPLAFFATALEPEDGELATWADSLSVQGQSLLWSLLVAGASLSALRQSGLELDRPVPDPASFDARLRHGLDETQRRVAAETLVDLEGGVEAEPLSAAPQRLSSLEEILALMDAASSAVAAELTSTADCLAEQGWILSLEPASARDRFARLIKEDGVPDAGALRRRVRARVAALGIGECEQNLDLEGIKTRIALLALAEALESAQDVRRG